VKAGYSVAFEPIEAAARQGQSKIRFAQDGAKFFLILLRVVTIFSPLRIFVPVAAASFLLGASYAAWTIAMRRDITDSAVLLIMFAAIVFLVGLVSEQITALRFEPRDDRRA
jgi:hypothetical protein